MRVHRFANEEDAARRAAEIVAAAAREDVAELGRFAVAFSGGKAPWRMLEILAAMDDVPWSAMTVFQTDERVTSEGGPDRNWSRIRARLGAVPAALRPMPVEERDLEAAAVAYARSLESVAGSPPVLGLVHLGLGADGHTASLVPGDPVLATRDTDVAATGPYRGLRRLTLTFPAIDRARRRLFLVTGTNKDDDKGPALEKLLAGDASIPAGRVRRDATTVVAAI